MPPSEERREGEEDRRSSWHLRLPKIRFLRPLLYAVVLGGVLLLLIGWWRNWRLGAEIVERDRVIAEQTTVVEERDETINVLLVVVEEGDAARVEADAAHEQTKRKLRSAERTLAARPTRVIRVPGDPIVRVITANGDTTQVTEELADFVEACNTLAVTCADYRVAAELKHTADSISIFQRDDVIAGHVAKDSSQAALDSTKTEQIKALKKRSAGSPIAVALGPGIYYDMTSCTATVFVSDPETGTSAVGTQDCPTFRWGVGITGGLDLVWTVDKLVWVAKLSGL